MTFFLVCFASVQPNMTNNKINQATMFCFTIIFLHLTFPIFSSYFFNEDCSYHQAIGCRKRLVFSGGNTKDGSCHPRFTLIFGHDFSLVFDAILPKEKLSSPRNFSSNAFCCASFETSFFPTNIVRIISRLVIESSWFLVKVTPKIL